jgi:hypothetical protein
MLIYEIYFEPSQNPPYSSELQNIFLELENIENPLSDACYFQERISEDSYEQAHYSYSSAHPTYLVFDERFLPYFADILLKSNAKKLGSAPSLKYFEIIYGSAIAISKAGFK